MAAGLGLRCPCAPLVAQSLQCVVATLTMVVQAEREGEGEAEGRETSHEDCRGEETSTHASEP